MSGPASYAAYLAAPGRQDSFAYIITVPDSTGTTQTLYWCRGELTTEPGDTPANTVFQPRVLQGGIEYESPEFDPHNPSWGVMGQPQPKDLVALQIDGDLDALRAYRWAGAQIEVRHGGVCRDGRLAFSLWQTISIPEVDGWPTWDLDRMKLPLRAMDARFDMPAERRKLASLGWCIEGDGAKAGASFNPFAPGVRLRGSETGKKGDYGADLVVTRPDPVVTGDLLLCSITTHSNLVSGSYSDWTCSSGLPAGWTLLDDTAAGPVGHVYAHRTIVAYKVAGASEPASYTFTGTGTPCDRCWEVTVWYGQDGTTPVANHGRERSVHSRL